MKSYIFTLAALLTLGVIASSPVAAQESVAGGQFNYCVATTYGAYNWVQFTNNCGQPLNITWFYRNRDYSGSSGTAQPGASVSTGESLSEVRNNGGYELYICPANYFPASGSGYPITNGGSNPQPYQCKHQ